jgi:hypothetical protein
MLLVTPVSHMHYYAMAMPLVCGLWLRGMAKRPGGIGTDRFTLAVLTAWGASTALPLFPWEFPTFLRQAGAGVYATVGLWAFALATIARRVEAVAVAEPMPEPRRLAA